MVGSLFKIRADKANIDKPIRTFKGHQLAHNSQVILTKQFF